MLRAHRKLGLELAAHAFEPLILRATADAVERRPEVGGDDRRSRAVDGDGQVNRAETTEGQAGCETANENASAVRALDLDSSRAIPGRADAELLPRRKRAPDPLSGEHRRQRIARIDVSVPGWSDREPLLPAAPCTADPCRPPAAQGLHVVDQLVDVSEGRMPPAPPAAQAYSGQASASFSRVCSSASGSTLTSASTGMKFVSPAQRGTMWR